MSSPVWPARYEIRVDGVLDDWWADWFDGLQVSSEGTQTAIGGQLADQSALHGVLAKIGDLGLCLISVRRLSPGENPGQESRGEFGRALDDGEGGRKSERQDQAAGERPISHGGK